MPARLSYTMSVAVACCMTVVATFLPWTSLTVELPIVGSIGTVTRYGYQGDGIITLLLALLAAGFAAYVWFDRGAAAFHLVTLFNAFVGAVILATALVNLFDSQRALGNAQQQLGVDLDTLLGIDLDSLMDTGEGVYVTIASGAILAVASLLAFAAHRFAPGGPLTADAIYCPTCGRRLP